MECGEFDSHTTTKYKYKIMSKECKMARNVVASAMVILAVLIVMLSMSSCSTSSSTCAAYTSVEKLNNCE